ncbi:hypothetical protein [Streptomyces himalayensis]|uniref:Uncharacterized protein n=1 Tax=Streptomyces himalayensis subsp. himalayensis TaxID=2756131 RepID=A0A7W0I921_9ACTN|nr:hypothetical protein [Streptomyces himalayensis]MBA2946641.1 hypothetical protein [Streptomyces himalayensis subsp. himalayensis]
MVRDLRNVRILSGDDAPTPLTDEDYRTPTDEDYRTPFTPDEEHRFRVNLVQHMAQELAEKGWARFPAYSPEERIRLYALAPALGEHFGRPVTAEPEDITRVRFAFGDLPLRPGAVTDTPGV